ncbi:type II toxin-antitoxin system ParD family antitoxin [Asticcacaulis sp. AC402]|uniref:type II toxin-antitoxin system ParD family antitoxin n=1 Tax=Asticcacaulis sp. AC402 TaxID=1282361 RepID=UPI0003C3E023|nr:type II toxin-antitoxin system ParD family antitoxin [Asticcacaulis sp. AC402]ESQ74521.1 antitoxin [Asticcacaulis sp. AC402]
MATMNISLPDQLKDWVESRSEDGRYANSSDYVRDLIRRDKERAEKIAAMQAKITEGLNSGISPHSFEEIMAIARRQADELGLTKP